MRQDRCRIGRPERWAMRILFGVILRSGIEILVVEPHFRCIEESEMGEGKKRGLDVAERTPLLFSGVITVKLGDRTRVMGSN